MLFDINIDFHVLNGIRSHMPHNPQSLCHLEGYHSRKVRHSDGRKIIQFKRRWVDNDNRILSCSLLYDTLLSKYAHSGAMS